MLRRNGEEKAADQPDPRGECPSHQIGDQHGKRPHHGGKGAAGEVEQGLVRQRVLQDIRFEQAGHVADDES